MNPTASDRLPGYDAREVVVENRPWGTEARSHEIYCRRFPWKNRSRACATPQSGQREPLPIDPRAWPRERGIYRRAVEGLVGPIPKPRGRLHPRVLVEGDYGAYWQYLVEYTFGPGDVISAYLLVPKKNPEGKLWSRSTRFPAVICSHQTHFVGKSEPVGQHGNDPNMWHAWELAQRGYVCLAPDHHGFGGRRREIFDRHYYEHDSWMKYFGRQGGGSAIGKMAADLSRGFDYLASLPFVDGNRVGIIGHSLGAYTALWTALFDPRLKVAVCSCAGNLFRDDRNAEGSQTDRWYAGTPSLPRLGFLGKDASRYPFDFHHLIALCAPRALFLNYSSTDVCSENCRRLDWVGEQAAKAYVAQGLDPGRFLQVVSCDAYGGGHAFPAPVRHGVFPGPRERGTHPPAEAPRGGSSHPVYWRAPFFPTISPKPGTAYAFLDQHLGVGSRKHRGG